MIFEHIEKLKKQYTDKYVVVDEGRPELKRFRGLTGTVKTVNMSGRALVEFDGYSNIGWYDIDPVFLKVVDAPPPKPVEAKKEKAAAPKAEKAAPAAAPAKDAVAKAAPAKPAPAKPAAAARACCGRQVGRRHHRRGQRWQSRGACRESRGRDIFCGTSGCEVAKRRGHSGRGSYQTGRLPRRPPRPR